MALQNKSGRKSRQPLNTPDNAGEPATGAPRPFEDAVANTPLSMSATQSPGNVNASGAAADSRGEQQTADATRAETVTARSRSGAGALSGDPFAVPVFSEAAIVAASDTVPRAHTEFPGAAGGDDDDDELLPLDKLSVAELVDLRGQIDKLLPARSLHEIDLQEAVLLQYHVANELMTKTLKSGEEANKKAQTVNTCTTILQQIVKMQSEIYHNERVKALELAIERTFREVVPEKKREFFERYKAAVLEVEVSTLTKAQRREQGT